MRLDQFLSELRNRRIVGRIIPGFFGSGGIGLVGVNIPEGTYPPIFDGSCRAPIRWPYSGITAFVALKHHQFFLNHQWRDAAVIADLSETDANAFELAEGMHKGHDSVLRKEILEKVYGLREPNKSQVLECRLQYAWAGRVYVPLEAEENPLILGGGINEPTMWA